MFSCLSRVISLTMAFFFVPIILAENTNQGRLEEARQKAMQEAEERAEETNLKQQEIFAIPFPERLAKAQREEGFPVNIDLLRSQMAELFAGSKDLLSELLEVVEMRRPRSTETPEEKRKRVALELRGKIAGGIRAMSAETAESLWANLSQEQTEKLPNALEKAKKTLPLVIEMVQAQRLETLRKAKETGDHERMKRVSEELGSEEALRIGIRDVVNAHLASLLGLSRRQIIRFRKADLQLEGLYCLNRAEVRTLLQVHPTQVRDVKELGRISSEQILAARADLLQKKLERAAQNLIPENKKQFEKQEADLRKDLEELVKARNRWHAAALQCWENVLSYEQTVELKRLTGVPLRELGKPNKKTKKRL